MSRLTSSTSIWQSSRQGLRSGPRPHRDRISPGLSVLPMHRGGDRGAECESAQSKLPVLVAGGRQAGGPDAAAHLSLPKHVDKELEAFLRSAAAAPPPAPESRRARVEPAAPA